MTQKQTAVRVAVTALCLSLAATVAALFATAWFRGDIATLWLRDGDDLTFLRANSEGYLGFVHHEGYHEQAETFLEYRCLWQFCIHVYTQGSPARHVATAYVVPIWFVILLV